MHRFLKPAVLPLLLAFGGASGGEPLPAPGQQPNPFAPLPEGTIVGVPGPPPLAAPPPPRNNVVIPPLDAEFVWKQLVDVADDFFKVRQEQRVLFNNGVPTEGRIDTFPQTGDPLLEPWRPDSVGFRERLEATMQSIRRVGTLRLAADPAGWRIDVVVQKELEHVARPMRATAGGASFRNDDSLYRYGTPLPTLGEQIGDQPRPVATPTATLGWIPLGRDPLLEQRMLARLLAKLGVAPLPQPEPYYQPPEAGGANPAASSPAALPAGPVYGSPIPPEQLPPGAVIAPGPAVPIESLPVPR
ncbi:MAG: hypothetical protein ACK6CT_06250 [Planctomycetia bacterium]